MTPDERRELAAEVALGTATADDVARLAEAAAADPSVARELEADRATVSALEAGLARETPSSELLERILGGLEAPEPPEVDAPAPAAPPKRRRWSGLRWPQVAIGAAVTAAVLVVAVVLVSDEDVEPDAVAAIAGKPDFAEVNGTARVFPEGGSASRLVVHLTSVPPAPTGHHYEVWVLPAGSDAMESVGEVAPSDGEADLEADIAGTGPFAAVDVSVEPDDGDPAHSGVSLAGGAFS